ncbi:MAG: hypothetical protein JSV26_06575 [bacterium]|nr:MAG: hypothetical protein JSV26_06575 [bacterium]
MDELEGIYRVIEYLSSTKLLYTLVIIFIAAAFGALGGLTQFLVGRDRSGSKDETDRPWLYSVVIGATAALASLFVFTPTDPIKLIGLCLIAGYAGKVLLDSLRTWLDNLVNRKVDVRVEEKFGAMASEFMEHQVPGLVEQRIEERLSGSENGPPVEPGTEPKRSGTP